MKDAVVPYAPSTHNSVPACVRASAPAESDSSSISVYTETEPVRMMYSLSTTSLRPIT
jgi:hypothetical protein